MDPSKALHLVSIEDIGPLAPTMFIVAMGVMTLLFDLFIPSNRRKYLSWLALGGLGFSLLLLVFMEARVFLATESAEDSALKVFDGCLRVDHMVVLAQKAILGVAALAILVSPRYLRDRKIPQGEYYALLLFATGSMMALAASNELLTLFLNLETLSITLYVLAGMERDNLRSTEAAFKYFLMGSFSAAFLLFGLVLVYGATGQTSFDAIRAMVAAPGAIHAPFLLAAGFALMMVGFAFKLTLFPFHMYAPDLYAGAPTPVVGLIATGSKIAGLASLFAVFRVIASWNGLPAALYYVFYALSVVSILVGNLGALTQPNLKRLLAYSGVAHSGYALIPMVAGLGVTLHKGSLDAATMWRAEAAISYYFLAYGLMTGLAFAVVATLGPQGESHLDRYAGLAKRSPFLAAAMALALISLTGVPPTVGFLGKFNLFAVAVKTENYRLACVGVLASVASAYYYLRVIVKMYMEEAPATKTESPTLETQNIFALAVGSLAILLFAVFPSLYLFE